MNLWVWIIPGIFLTLCVGAYGASRMRALRRNVVGSPHAMAGGLASVLDCSVLAADNHVVPLTQYKGRVVLIVNVASKCGFTGQYNGLQSLYAKYKDRGLIILGFPANDFGAQEPGTDGEIQSFCQTSFGVTFPVLAKVAVKGPNKYPVFQALTQPQTAGPFAGEIAWNFTKFLIDREGRIAGRFGPATTPENAQFLAAVESAWSAP